MPHRLRKKEDYLGRLLGRLYGPEILIQSHVRSSMKIWAENPGLSMVPEHGE